MLPLTGKNLVMAISEHLQQNMILSEIEEYGNAARKLQMLLSDVYLNYHENLSHTRNALAEVDLGTIACAVQEAESEMATRMFLSYISEEIEEGEE